jgi:LAO/AO transport system kinase
MADSQFIDASLQPILDGDRLALARLITQVENETQQGRLALSRLFPATGRAHLIGVTGPPGTGKSSLVNQLARYFRHPASGETSRRVGIVAVDPSSPFTGGAILGDRVRMRDLAGDPGIFIRSMASRGSLGGLARATTGVVQALDAAGFELILIETVGAGQAEVDIASLAHTTLVVEAPGMGDDIQAIKAGILEIADLLVVNKADRPNADATERALRGMLQLAHPTQHVFRHHGQLEHVFVGVEKTGEDHISTESASMWIPPILRTVATEGTGVKELARAISRHATHLRDTNDWQRRERTRLQAELDALLQESLVSRWRGSVSEEHYQQVLQQLVERQVSPWQAVSILLDGGA